MPSEGLAHAAAGVYTLFCCLTSGTFCPAIARLEVQ